MAELREITDVATMVNTIGGGAVSKQGLALETQAGTTSLLGKLERSLFWANSGLSDLHFDGIFGQIGLVSYPTNTNAVAVKIDAGDDNYEDLQGAALTSQKLLEGIYKVYSAPNYGIPTAILVEPRTYAALQAEALNKARFGLEANVGAPLTLYQGQLMIAGPTGSVPIHSCPLLLPPQSPPAAAVNPNGDAALSFNGGAPSVSATVYAQGDLAGENYPGAGSNLHSLKKGAGTADASDNGVVSYKVIAVNANGHSAPSVAQSTEIISATRSVRLRITDNTLTKTDLYYRVYRNEPGGGTADSDYKWAFDVPATGSGDTDIFDDFAMRAGTAPAFILQATPDVMIWTQLLDFLRRPLAQTNTSVPFLLMLFGSPFVKVPSKNFIFGNCKVGV